MTCTYSQVEGTTQSNGNPLPSPSPPKKKLKKESKSTALYKTEFLNKTKFKFIQTVTIWVVSKPAECIRHVRGLFIIYSTYEKKKKKTYVHKKKNAAINTRRHAPIAFVLCTGR
jgi:hypothetical protein